MNNQAAKWLDLIVLYEREISDVEWVFWFLRRLQQTSANTTNSSVVVVHDLEADSAWAWVWKIEVEKTDQYKKVNWLADKNLLSAKMLHARIMIFNYESKWHKDASKQRRDLCVNQLLTALDNKRKEVRR